MSQSLIANSLATCKGVKYFFFFIWIRIKSKNQVRTMCNNRLQSTSKTLIEHEAYILWSWNKHFIKNRYLHCNMTNVQVCTPLGCNVICTFPPVIYLKKENQTKWQQYSTQSTFYGRILYVQYMWQILKPWLTTLEQVIKHKMKPSR